MKNVLWVFFVSMIPVIELRGAIPIGCAAGLPVWEVFLVAMVGCMVPVPFIILFIRKIFALMRKWWPKLDGFITKIENRALKKANSTTKAVGLALFAALPLPGAGAWTSALIAALLDLRMSKALPSIFLGVVIEGVIFTALSYGVRLGVTSFG